MDPKSFLETYMQKNGLMNEGPEMAAIIQQWNPETGAGRGYRPERVDLPRTEPDEVVVPVTSIATPKGEMGWKPRRFGSYEYPSYTGGIPASMVPGHVGTKQDYRDMGISEDYIEGLGYTDGVLNVPAYIDTTNTEGAYYVDNPTERPAVILPY